MKKDKFLLFDGAMGTMLQKYGLPTGALPELFNISHPQIIERIHREYINAGADVITTNTFGANSFKLNGEVGVTQVVAKSVALARSAGARLVALDIGPTGSMLEPLGTTTFQECYDCFKEVVTAGRDAGADIILIETMSDLLETKAAVLAAKENSSLPVFVTMTYMQDGRTFLGTDAVTATITLCSLGVDAVGINCSLGPQEMLKNVEQVCRYATCPVIVQPNAGLPKLVNNQTIYDITPCDFADSVSQMLHMGVSIIGGCCGTTPEYIAELRKLISSKIPVKRDVKHFTAFTSAAKTVFLEDVAVIGERINPTGKPKLKNALRTKDYRYIVGEALQQEACGADILDVNVGLPEIDETQTLVEVVKELQSVCYLPLQIDSSDSIAVEAAVRIYNGKPIINSVNGTEDSMSRVLPIVKKYGTAVVGLTLDDNIPKTALQRLAIAQRIVDRAIKMGIPKEDILIDCLVMTIATDETQAEETLKAVKLVREKIGVKTVLGVSNISFGLPDRETINCDFLASALNAGLNLPIINPMIEGYQKVLRGEGNIAVMNTRKYLKGADNFGCITDENDIKGMIICGAGSKITEATARLLQNMAALDIINKEFIPALNVVGEKYEKGEMFLPQLIASAEAVKCGLTVIKNSLGDIEGAEKRTVLLATVKGDIHDIGKNIVRMLLESYGFRVIDMGKDVAPEKIVKRVQAEHIKLVGLSALMTTTVSNMAVTIRMLREAGCDCKVIVGGAVLNEDYARMVGADYYGKDANDTVRMAQEILG